MDSKYNKITLVNKQTKMYPRGSIKNCACLCGFSAFFLIFGIVIICLRTFLYNSIINSMFVLRPNSTAYEQWKMNTIPLTLNLYMWNWTNPNDVTNSSVKPIFQELGPYVFDETKEKVNLTWNENNNTVSYYNLKKWWFNEKRSNGTLNDPVTSVNPVSLSSVVTAKDWNFIVKKGLNTVLTSVSAGKSSIYGTHSVGEVLFDGYEDPVLTMAQTMPTFEGVTIPKFDKFGWFYTRNNSESYEGQFNMDMGITGQLGELYSWKYMQYTSYYPEQCGKVQGSAGEFFPSNLRKDSLVRFFSADLCRFVVLEFEKEVIISGVLGYKFVAGDRFLDNGTKIPENRCFCIGDCQPYGALDISACRYGSPAYVSLPHFHKADPYYTSLIEGVKSNNNSHDFYMIFEPKTGLPLEVSARLQVNLLLQPVSGMGDFAKVPRVFMPILWFEQVVKIPEDIIFYVSILINFEVICLAAGIIIIFFAVLLEVCCCYRLCSTSIIKKELPVITREEVPLTHRNDKVISIDFKKAIP